MVLFFFCRFFFAPPGEKEPTKGKESVVCVSPLYLSKDERLRARHSQFSIFNSTWGLPATKRAFDHLCHSQRNIITPRARGDLHPDRQPVRVGSRAHDDTRPTGQAVGQR